MTKNQLFYGDNLEVLKNYIPDESVDLIYIDPPFNSKRNYNQIYNNIGEEDVAQAQAFVDTWTWNFAANEGLDNIIANKNQLFSKQSINLIIGLEKVLGKGSMLAYLISLTQRISEMYRVLKPTGSFYLHCDPTASHYLKLVLDGIFCARGGSFQNEIKWNRANQHNLATRRFDNVLDSIFFYTKSSANYLFNPLFNTSLSEKELEKKFPHIEKETKRHFGHFSLENSANFRKNDETRIIQGKTVKTKLGWKWSQATFDSRLAENPNLIYWTKNDKPRYKIYEDEYSGRSISNDWNDIKGLTSQAKERLGYPTQKPESLLERIILASSNEHNTILDAYCGCGTTIAVAERLKRNWIGIDITYQSISLILKRLEDTFGKDFSKDYADKETQEIIPAKLILNGVPRDFESAVALAHKVDDRLRKEFEKWAVLTFSNNRAVINEKKGKDEGIDGIAYILDLDETNKQIYKQVLFSVKSNKSLSPNVIRDLNGTLEREKAVIGYFITLYPMENLEKEARKYGNYQNKMLNNVYQKIEVITIQEMLDGKRMNLPIVVDVLKSAERKTKHQTKNIFEK